MPKGWKTEKLVSICTKITDGAHHSPKSVSSGYPMFSVKDMTHSGFRSESARHISEADFKALERQNCKPLLNDILIAKDGSILKYCFVVEEEIDGVILSSIALLRPNLNIVEPKFISHYFSQDWVKFYVGKALTSGSGVPRIILKDFKSIKIPLPPLPEQRKVAKILSTWDKAISTTERLIDNSKQQKKALMQQLLTGKKRLFDDSGKPFEGVWEEITLEKLAKYRRGSFPQPYGNPEWVDEVNGYPFIQVYDIDKNMKLKSDTKIKISDAAIGKSVFIPKDTVIVSLQGSIGRVAITQYDAYVDRTVLLFQEFIVPMDKVFFAFIIQELFEIEKTKAPGGTIKTITKEVLSNFKVHIPSITEQQKIASILINADQEIELLEQQLADLKQEKKALMQQLLTGKRRVKVDDEALT